MNLFYQISHRLDEFLERPRADDRAGIGITVGSDQAGRGAGHVRPVAGTAVAKGGNVLVASK